MKTKKPLKTVVKRNRIPAATALLVLLTWKPLVDLFWGFGVNVGGFSINPLSVAGLIILFYFLLFVANTGIKQVPLVGLLVAFFALHLYAFALGILTGVEISLSYALNILIRIATSIVLYVAAFQIARRSEEETKFVPYIIAAFWGLSVVIVLNVAAISLGFGGARDSGNLELGVGTDRPYRETSLYHDAGTMGMVALNGMIFSAAVLVGGYVKRGWRRIVAALTICLGAYLILMSVSRTMMVLVVINSVVFFTFFAKGSQKIKIAGALGVLVLGVLIVGGVDSFIDRFQSETQAISNVLDSEDGGNPNVSWEIHGDDAVSLGSLEGLGSNRGKLWSWALTEIMKRDLLTFAFGTGRGRGAHSDYIDVLSRTGVVGLALYFFIFFGLMIKTAGRFLNAGQTPQRLGCFLAFLLSMNFLLYAFPFRPLLYTTPFWYMWILAGISLAGTKRVSLVQR